MLYVGFGIFRLVKVENIEEYDMYLEYYYFLKEIVEIINEIKRRGNKVILVGIIFIRILEIIGDENGFVKE